MKNEREIRLFIYRYHLIPLSSESKQTSLFGDEISIDEIKKNKNNYFEDVLSQIEATKGKNPIKLFDSSGKKFLLKIAQKKNQTVTKDFKREIISNEPYCYVIINNDPKVQKIAISDNSMAFSNTDVVKNILGQIFQNKLKRYSLSIEIEQMFDAQSFWSYIRTNQDSVQRINFEFIKPNLAEISKSLSSNLRNLQDDVNSHRTSLIVSAPQKGTLENINEENETIKGLVDYSSEGGGNIKVKVKGLRKQLKTKDNPVTLKIKEIHLEGTPEQVMKVYRDILNS